MSGFFLSFFVIKIKKYRNIQELKRNKSTNFQKMVWDEIKKIPRGKTISYKRLAVKIGREKSYRAVANACANNPKLITVPCHRVIRSDGKLGGYMGQKGIDRKKNFWKKKVLNLKIIKL